LGGRRSIARRTVPMKRTHKLKALALAAVACVTWFSMSRPTSGTPTDDGALSAAICPIVYPVDQSPSDRGYRYLFYGNGFFINEQGYLMTAAHVLSQLHGGLSYVLLRQRSGPPRFVLATLIVVDRDHDVAILRAAPNPFEGRYKVAFLPLAYDWLAHSHAVLTAALRPSRPLDAYTLDASVDERSPSEVFDFKFSQLDKGRSDTELFLFNNQVRRGQSGAPIVSADSQGVVGLVEGLWLRSSLVPLAAAAEQDTPGIGAGVPIHYAIALLQQRGIRWYTPSGTVGPYDTFSGNARGFSPPTPISVVTSPYPSQSLFGGEVVLDALIDNRGRMVETKVVRGASPFLENALSTVRTWSFFPARLDGQAVAARIGITFQFSQSHEPPRSTPPQEFDESSPSAADRAALPVTAVEPQYPAASTGDGSVILYDLVGTQGQLTSVQVLRDTEPFTTAALTAVRQWHFVPGRRAGADSDSAAIVVVAFRYSGTMHSLARTK
jgi:TonB family protein